MLLWLQLIKKYAGSYRFDSYKNYFKKPHYTMDLHSYKRNGYSVVILN